MAERFLVTGALGCIGAWTVRRLLADGAAVFSYDLPGDPHRLRLVLEKEAALAELTMISGDVTDLAGFERAVADHEITHIVHLAGLQIPLVRADPVRGVQVNAVGTTVVFEAARRHRDQVRGLAYASSAAVWGPRSAYRPGRLTSADLPAPVSLYGVTKLANEGTARVYWSEHELASVGLRPFVVYGAGRDQGVTSFPSKAMLAAAVGRDYAIELGGPIGMEYADDVAALFIRAARATADGTVRGAVAGDVGGPSAGMPEIVAAIEAAAPEAAGRITLAGNVGPSLPEVSGDVIAEALGGVTFTPLAEGVGATIELFRAAAASGRIDVDRALVSPVPR
jgi:nucleoside-diphosphate-sugar epimerase